MVSGKNNSFGSENNTDFKVENVLKYRSKEEIGTFWLGPNQEPAEFVLELCRSETIRRLRIVNTQGGELRNRGTKDFKVLVRNRLSEDWILGCLPNTMAWLLDTSGIFLKKNKKRRMVSRVTMKTIHG